MSPAPPPAPENRARAADTVFPTFAEAESYLNSLINYENHPQAPAPRFFGLERVRQLAACLGHPEAKFPALHITGSKGKGSTAAICEAVLQAHGLRTGLYTSPHLESVRERIRLEGRDISEAQFCALLGRLRPYLEQLRRDDLLPDEIRRATYFEALTHLAFLAFAEGVEVGIIEVGMGGRLDATNILGQVIVSGVTDLELEHTAVLGETIEEIAAEKAGIMRAGVPVWIRSGAGEQTLRRCAARVGAPVGSCGGAGDEVRITAAEGPRFTVELPGLRLPGLQIRLLGEAQQRNAAQALALCDTFLQRTRGARLDPERTKEGLSQVHCPGRCELVRRPGRPAVVLDGAHTPRSLLPLLQAIGDRPAILVFGCAEDKKLEAMAEVLQGRFRQVIATRTPNPKSFLPETVAAAFAKRGESVSQAPGGRAALELAEKLAAPGELLVVTGSFYLVGEIRPLVVGGAQMVP